jgi:hypothetical protein
MNIIKKIIKNKMKKVLDLFLNLGYNICVCESVRVKNKNNKNNKMEKKYILVGCGGMNSEIKRFNKEFNNWKDCYNYVYNECKNDRMYSEEIDSDGWVMWERESYMLDIDCWRDDIKLNEKDVVIGIWGIGESDEVYEVIVGDSIDDEMYKIKDDIKDKDGREISIGKFVEIKNNDISDGIVIGFDEDDIDVLEIGDGYSINKEDIEVVGELNG